MKFTFQTRTNYKIEVSAKTAKQAAQLAAFKIWQSNRHPELTAHTQIAVTTPETGNADNDYGVTFKAPSEKSSYTFATILKLKF